MRSVLPSKFASVAAHFIFPRSKLFAGAVYQSPATNLSGCGSGFAGAGAVVSRSSSWMRRLSESVGSEIIAICVAVPPLNWPTSGIPAAGGGAGGAAQQFQHPGADVAGDGGGEDRRGGGVGAGPAVVARLREQVE